MKLSRDLFVLSSALRTNLRSAFYVAVNVTLLALAADRRHAAVDTDQKAAAPAAIDRYYLPAGPRAANSPHRAAAGEWDRPTDGHSTVAAYHASTDKNCCIVLDGSVAEWLACWIQAQKAWVQIAVATLSANSLRQTVHIHCASVHQALKLVAALLRVARVTAGLAESNGSLPPGL